jgi:hypothetical protein
MTESSPDSFGCFRNFARLFIFLQPPPGCPNSEDTVLFFGYIFCKRKNLSHLKATLVQFLQLFFQIISSLLCVFRNFPPILYFTRGIRFEKGGILGGIEKVKT